MGLIGIMLHCYGMVDAGIAQGKGKEKVRNYLLTNGYAAANEEHKVAQIQNLLADYHLGIISYDELIEKIQDSNLSKLEIDDFVKTYLTDEQYQKYLKLKEDNDNNMRKVGGHINGALVGAGTGIVMVSGAAAADAAIKIKKKRDEKNAKKEEAKKLKQEQLAKPAAEDCLDA